VGELEILLEEHKADSGKTEQELRDKVHDLEADLQALRTKCLALENMLQKERTEREQERTQWTPVSRPPVPLFPPEPIEVTFVPTGRGTRQRRIPAARLEKTPAAQRLADISHLASPPETGDTANGTCSSCESTAPCSCVDREAVNTIGCGKCSSNTRCECLEESLKALEAVHESVSKRPSSPSLHVSEEKRQRQESQLETDFTPLFARAKQTTPAPSIAVSPRNPTPAPYLALAGQATGQQGDAAETVLRDRCGFCKDGTYCICADSQAGFSAMSAATPSRQTQTPPPSDTDFPPPLEVTATGAIRLPRPVASRRDTPSSCGPNGPGSCAQCLSDPRSGLFCRSLAANFERQGGCCGGKNASGGCCKQLDPTTAAQKKKIDMGLSLSCADAYKTLSSHRHFDEAADEIGSWLPKLRAAPKSEVVDAGPRTRHPLDVEAASIMSVLKGFDVRFGN
jgi:hypothetical protein